MKALPIIAFATYMIILVKLVLFKDAFFYQVVPTTEYYKVKTANADLIVANLVPFRTIMTMFAGDVPLVMKFYNVFGNILLFIPYGFLLPQVFRDKVIFFDIIYTAVILSLCFELIQYATRTGQFDVDDIILNTLGGMIGHPLFLLYTDLMQVRRLKKQRRRKQRA